MNFEHSEKSLALQEKLRRFMDTHIYPIEKQVAEFMYDPANNWQHFPQLESLKTAAKSEGLWNLFLPTAYGDLSPGLTNLEYASLAEIMGRVLWSSEVFNCSAPDTGNMEVLAKYRKNGSNR